MSHRLFIVMPLWGLVILGFLGALIVSIKHISGAACPSFFSVPVCFVVTVAYGLMLASLAVKHKFCKFHSFCFGWGLAFTIALLATLAEVFSGGGVCPSSGGGIRGSEGTPLCFISLVMLVAIMVLFCLQSKSKTHNAE